MSRAIVDGQLYIDGLPFDSWEDYMKLLLDVTEPDPDDNYEEPYYGLTVEECNR